MTCDYCSRPAVFEVVVAGTKMNDRTHLYCKRCSRYLPSLRRDIALIGGTLKERDLHGKQRRYGAQHMRTSLYRRQSLRWFMRHSAARLRAFLKKNLPVDWHRIP